MFARLRVLPVVALAIAIVGVALLWGRPSSAILYTGTAEVDSGTLSLALSVSPPIGQPGDELTLATKVANRGFQPATPAITLKLPQGLSAGVYDLPPGATFNLQSNEINWLPSLAANGGSASFELKLRVESVDVVNPVQEVSAVVLQVGEEHRAAAQLWLGIPPLVRGTLAQTRAAVGQPVQLTADIVGPEPITEVWELGDGRRLDVPNPVVSYAAPGQYEVVVEASNPAGTVRSSSLLTIVADPVASIVVDDDTPGVGQKVLFSSTSGGQPPLRLTWDFGDGTPPVEDPAPVHVYAASGSYRVRLLVENDFGRSEAYWQVNVGAPPVADLMIAEQAAVGQALEGQALGDPSITGYTWDMGDGRGYEGQTVSHRYRVPGDYYITLIARNDFGETRTGRWVRIDPGMTTLYMPSVLFSGEGEQVALSADAPEVAALDPLVPSVEGAVSVAELSFPAGTTPAEQLYAYINEARAQFGLGPLAFANELNRSAALHSQDKTRFPDDPHTGTDGTTPAERLLRSGYSGGYAGEATAWGFQDARQAVEFWMNSPSHQPILLNRNATDVGVGYIEDYSSANIWHWTADFGTRYTGPLRPSLRLQEPAPGTLAANTDFLNYSWVWAAPLASDQRFVVYLTSEDERIGIGVVNTPVYGSRYVLSADAVGPLAALWGPGVLSVNLGWQVRLEDGRGSVLAESETRPLAIRLDPELALPTPTLFAPTPGALVTATPLGMVAPTATPLPPTAVPPTVEPPPVIVTATPAPEDFFVTATPQP